MGWNLPEQLAGSSSRSGRNRGAAVASDAMGEQQLKRAQSGSSSRSGRKRRAQQLKRGCKRGAAVDHEAQRAVRRRTRAYRPRVYGIVPLPRSQALGNWREERLVHGTCIHCLRIPPPPPPPPSPPRLPERFCLFFVARRRPYIIYWNTHLQDAALFNALGKVRKPGMALRTNNWQQYST